MTHPARRLPRAPVAAASIIAVAAALTLVASSPTQAEPPAAVGEFAQDTAATATDVTLITGDVVHLSVLPDGRAGVTVTPAPRPGGTVPKFRVSGSGDRIQVLPSDVAPLVPERLDAALFDVAALAEQGFDDASSGHLPLLAEYAADTTLSDAAIPGTEATVRLESVDAVGLELDKTAAAELGAALADSITGEASAFAAGPLAGVEKLWLDARVEANLDRSTAQISADAVWETGVDGSGVTVAVLDTGIDDTHPDLAGQVAATANFTTTEDYRDRNGHGTHVASIVAGTGDPRSGVAPGADLVVGKVLDDGGGGQVSWLIDGMEWAAEQDADVVNMSLGLSPGHYEAPMLTDAIDELSDSTGVLFVVAAGNAGCDACIGSPGDAPSALTVGAVDHDDVLADFSNRGPVYEGFGLKPDITAPGVDIWAARADGTGEDDDPYTAYSGTSMAAPMVSGAAALLLAAEPDLTGPELKAALMAGAVPTEGASVFEQGTGRVDVARSIEAAVRPSEGSLDFGFFAYPQSDREPAVREVAYTNTTEAEIVLDLTAAAAAEDGTAAEGLSVEPSTLSIPPGASATARVTVDAEAAADGRYTGELTATADGAAVRTPVAFEVEAVHYELTLDAVARDGRPARTWANHAPSLVFDVETGEPMLDRCDSGPNCFRVPAGTYSVMSYIYTKPAWAASDGSPYTDAPLHTTLAGDPELVVEDDTHVTFDARDAVEVTVDTPEHDGKANTGGAVELAWTRTFANGETAFDYDLNGAGAQVEERFFMLPTGDVTIGGFTATSRWRLEAPAVAFDAEGLDLDPQYFRADWFSDHSWQFPALEGERELRVADAGEATEADIAAADLDGALALIERSDDASVAVQSNRAAEAGAAMVAVYNDEPGLSNRLGATGTFLEAPTVRLSREEGLALLEALESGGLTVAASGTRQSPYRYDLVYAERGGISGDLHYTADADDLTTVERDFYSMLDQEAFSETSYAFQPDAGLATGIITPLLGAPRTRVDYHVSDPAVAWQYAVHAPERAYNHMRPQDPTGSLNLTSGLCSYEPGGHYEQSWHRQPLAPAFDPARPVTRQGDVLTIPTAGVVDDGGNFTETPSNTFEGGIDSHFRIWHGDELLGETHQLPQGTLTLPPQSETYRFTYEVNNDSAWASESTRTSTEWTFTSASTDPDAATPVPLLTLDYDLNLDMDNSVPGFRERLGLNLIGLTLGDEGGDPVRARSLTFSTSFDDGETWQRAPVLPLWNGEHLVFLPGKAPRNGSGFISFQVTAEDRHGGEISQEIIRATAYR
ncbi:S8 family serine peptidase [Glycomyces sp. A-F 0318]|uniref:S8 family peptidase n=1 Tax=Glycomyces amatae TaxID=2881355 RepID=UPI001E3007E3|nr:S8 family serine peptidase [Glycomyces amatae]